MIIKKKVIGLNTILRLLLVFLITFSIPLSYVQADSNTPKVYDYYGLFTDSQLEELEELLNDYSQEGKVDILVITTDNLNNKSKQTYMEDFYDSNAPGYDKEFGDTILLMLYMNPKDRSVEIQGYGKAEYSLDSTRIESVLDAIVPYLADGDYMMAMEEYASLVSSYMNTEPANSTPSNPNSTTNTNRPNPNSSSGKNTNDSNPSYNTRKEDPLTNPLYQFIASALLGAIIVGIMAYHSSGRITTNNRTYLNEEHSSVVAHHDIYLRTTTSRVKKPDNNNNNNGGHTGGGTSSGGHSHSGGGRSF